MQKSSYTCSMSFLLAMSFFHSGTHRRGMIGCRREYVASLKTGVFSLWTKSLRIRNTSQRVKTWNNFYRMAKRLGLPISFKLTRYNTQLRPDKISTLETRISVVQYYRPLWTTFLPYIVSDIRWFEKLKKNIPCTCISWRLSNFVIAHDEETKIMVTPHANKSLICLAVYA